MFVLGLLDEGREVFLVVGAGSEDGLEVAELDGVELLRQQLLSAVERDIDKNLAT